MRILVIVDDRDAASFVLQGLQATGHEAVHAGSGAVGLTLAAEGGFDAVVLDRSLPGELDGLQVIKSLRSRGDVTPVLVLSTLAGVDERVQGLNAGADDYLSRPFVFAELLARLEALVRRGKVAPGSRLEVGELEMDLLARTVRRNGRKIDLQPREFRLLEYLMRHAGEIVTRTMLLEGVWDYHFDPQTNVIDVHVSRLRQKIDKPFHDPLIQTVRNAGYLLRGRGMTGPR